MGVLGFTAANSCAMEREYGKIKNRLILESRSDFLYKSEYR